MIHHLTLEILRRRSFTKRNCGINPKIVGGDSPSTTTES
ncbi:unnamed protein product [Brassica oleracea var. botrytis]|uniref:Uncharacterized protein n=2 Tax=Brassica TaxID=3705 RepID=A0A3P6F4E8_BRAOL|nr:unnamed protein product [Brassica napus]CDY64593.1 BnaCnng44250D [Brassica napus]VDD44666.1 unnamed protein product [Brassica oleracea]